VSLSALFEYNYRFLQIVPTSEIVARTDNYFPNNSLKAIENACIILPVCMNLVRCEHDSDCVNDFSWLSAYNLIIPKTGLE